MTFIIVGFLLAAFFVGILWAMNELQQKTRQRFASNWKTLPKPAFPFQELVALTADGLKIHSWYTPAKGNQAIVILAHGFGLDGGKSEMMGTAHTLQKAGYGTVLVDLRGVGQSEGDGEKLGTKEWQDLEALYNALKTLPENTVRKIGFLGESMGAASAITTVGRTGKGDFVIVIVPFANLNKIFALRMTRRKIPVWLGLPFLKLAARIELGFNYQQFSPDVLIQKIKVPLFIAWATHDKVIGANQGSFLILKANEPKIGWAANTNHNLIKESGELFNQKILAFLDNYVS